MSTENGIPGSLTSQQVWFFRHVGFLRLRRILPIDLVTRLQTLIDHLFTESTEPVERGSTGIVIRLSDLVSRDPAFDAVARLPALLDPLESLLGPNIDLLHNRHNHVSRGFERTYRNRLHRDALQWTRGILTVLLFLDDCLKAEAATRIIPGSQLLSFVADTRDGGTWMDEHPVYSDLTDQAIPVPAAMGDLLVIDGLTFHAGGLVRDRGNERRIIALAYTSVDELLGLTDVPTRTLVRGQRIQCGSHRELSANNSVQPS